MNTVEERLARYRYELDSVESTDAIGDVKPSGAPSGGGRRALLLVAAAVLVIAGLVAVTRRGDNNTPASGSGSAPFAWTTSRVVFTANTFTIDVGGKQFSPTGVKVDAYSDPGNATYATLELQWEQYGVPMWVNMYFTADASNWWVTEIRTYNGLPADTADWVTVTGEQFRTPLGDTYAGDVDVTANENEAGIISHLRIGGMTLALLPPSNSVTSSSVPGGPSTPPSDTADAGVGTTTIPVPVPPVTGVPEQWYSVPEATTGASVAKQFAVSAETLAALNGWTDGVNHLVTAGSTVRIPPGASMLYNAVVPYGTLVVDAEGNTVGVGGTNDLSGVCLLLETQISGCDTVAQPTPKVVVTSSEFANPANTLIYGIADADLSHLGHMRCRPMPVVLFVAYEIMCCKPWPTPCG